eukprot:12857985-Alexandrium_andersonii.AAC.1
MAALSAAMPSAVVCFLQAAVPRARASRKPVAGSASARNSGGLHLNQSELHNDGRNRNLRDTTGA